MMRGFELGNLDHSDVKRFSIALAFTFAAMSKGADIHNYGWESRLLMGLATAALAAWVTLAVIQVALRTEHFDIHVVYIYSELGRAICKNCFEIYSIPINPRIEYYPWGSRLYGGTIRELDRKVPKVLGCVIAKLSRFGYKTSNDVKDYRPMTTEQEEAIYNACRSTCNWWRDLKPKLAIAQSYTYHREMKKDILSYERNMDTKMEHISRLVENNVIQIGTGDFFVLVDIMRLNKGLYEALLEEVGSKHHAPNSPDSWSGIDDEEECKSYPN